MIQVPEGITERTVQLDEVNIHYYEAGQGDEPVILLHGGGVDSALISWSDIIPGLAQYHRVIAPDLPGYGKSDRPDVEYSLEYYRDFLCRFMDALQIESASLVGLSLGGGTALAFVLQHPHKVKKLVLVDTYGLMSRIPFHFLSYLYVITPLNDFSYWLMSHSRSLVRQMLLAGLIYDPQNATPELVDLVYQALRQPGAGKSFKSFQRSEVGPRRLRSDFSDRLGEIKAPTLLVHGDHDSSVPLECVRRAQKALPDVRLVVLKNRRHWPMRENPQEFISIVLDFLRE